jgi:hypothetical protein
VAIGPILPDFVVVALDNDVLNDWRCRKPATLKAINDYIGLVKAPGSALLGVLLFATPARHFSGVNLWR